MPRLLVSDPGTTSEQGCQIVSFQTKNPNLGKFWRALERKKLIYILGPFGIFNEYLGYFRNIWYSLSSFGIFFWFWYQVPRKIWQPCF
jgi:hypothetical protein